MIGKLTVFETVPVGMMTVRLAVPGVAIRLAGIVAINWLVVSSKEVGSADPFHCRFEPPENPVPFALRVKAAPPAVALEGLREVMKGGAGGVMVKLTALEIAPFAFCTVMLAVPAVKIRSLLMEACN